MTKYVLWVAASVCGLAFSHTALAGGTPAVTFQGLGQMLGSSATRPARISADGSTVVGIAEIGSQFQAFRWTIGSGMQALAPLPGGVSSQALGVSGNGSVVVGWADGPDTRAVRWDSNGSASELGVIPGNALHANSVSRDGLTVSVNGSLLSPTYRWTEFTGYQALNLLPGGTLAVARQMSLDGNAIVGEANSSTSGSQAFRWTQATGTVSLGNVPGYRSSAAKGTNADGSVVVGIVQGTPGFQAFRWTQATGMVGLGAAPGDLFSQVFACSGDGSVIVGADSLAASSHPIIWRTGTGMERLDNLLTGVLPANWQLQSALSISEDGTTITGVGLHNGMTEAWVATIPSPSSAAVLACGLLAVGRRRRHNPR